MFHRLVFGKDLDGEIDVIDTAERILKVVYRYDRERMEYDTDNLYFTEKNAGTHPKGKLGLSIALLVFSVFMLLQAGRGKSADVRVLQKILMAFKQAYMDEDNKDRKAKMAECIATGLDYVSIEDDYYPEHDFIRLLREAPAGQDTKDELCLTALFGQLINVWECV